MPDAARLLLASGVVLAVGLTLLLSELRWFRRAPLDERLRPFAGPDIPRRHRAKDWRDAVLPLVERTGQHLSRLFGVNDDVGTRLRQANIEGDVGTFRLRQLGWGAGALAVALVAMAATRPPLPAAALFLAGAPLLAFLLLEQQLSSAVQTRRSRLLAELPVVSEQLAMLLSAGFSLASALNRLSERSGGAVSEDLRAVRDRMSHGVTASDALQEWAALADLPELDRLVTVLALSSDTGDLGRLVGDEAKSIRSETQRRLAETIDRRAQQVWVPVTVATLVPGVIFLTIPFVQALSLFTTG